MEAYVQDKHDWDSGIQAHSPVVKLNPVLHAVQIPGSVVHLLHPIVSVGEQLHNPFTKSSPGKQTVQTAGSVLHYAHPNPVGTHEQTLLAN